VVELDDAAAVALVDRYRLAAAKLVAQIEHGDDMARRHGLAYLDAALGRDILAELSLRDAYEDLERQVLRVLERVDAIRYRGGLVRVDALGLPHFYPGPGGAGAGDDDEEVPIRESA
jgi:hypothetical protein